jgi:TP901 family phage tail tape measure protein
MRQSADAVNQFARVARSAVTAPLKKFEDFEFQLAKVQAKTAELTANEFSDLVAKAKELGSTTQFTAVQAGEGMELLATAGFKANEQIATMGPLLDLAMGSGLELAQTAEIMADAIAEFGLEADQSQRVADLMAATSTNATTNVGQLGEALSFAGTSAANMGVSLEDTMLLLGAFALKGVKASRAGTALDSTLSRLAFARRKKGRELLSGLLGGEVKDEDFKKPIQLLTRLRDSMESLSKVKKSAVLKTIFGQEGARGVGALLTVIGTDKFKQLQAGIDGSGGAVRKMAAIMEDTGVGAVRELESATEGLSIALGESLSGEAKDIRLVIADMVRWVTDWIEAHPILTKVIMFTVAAVAALMTILGGLLIVLSTFFAAKGIIALAGGFSLFAKMLIGPVLVGLKAVGAALLFLFTNPIGLAILGITALVVGAVLLAKHWDTAAESFQGFVDTMTEAMGPFAKINELIQEQLPTFLGGSGVGGELEAAASRADELAQLSQQQRAGTLAPEDQAKLESLRAQVAKDRAEFGLAPVAGGGGETNVAGVIKVQVEGPGQVTETKMSGPIDLNVDAGLATVGI